MRQTLRIKDLHGHIARWLGSRPVPGAWLEVTIDAPTIAEMERMIERYRRIAAGLGDPDAPHR